MKPNQSKTRSRNALSSLSFFTFSPVRGLKVSQLPYPSARNCHLHRHKKPQHSDGEWSTLEHWMKSFPLAKGSPQSDSSWVTINIKTWNFPTCVWEPISVSQTIINSFCEKLWNYIVILSIFQLKNKRTKPFRLNFGKASTTFQCPFWDI